MGEPVILERKLKEHFVSDSLWDRCMRAEAKIVLCDEHRMEENYAKMQVAALKARLEEQAATIERLTGLLKRLEWPTPWGSCAICGNNKFIGDGHKMNCEVNAALSKQEPK